MFEKQNSYTSYFFLEQCIIYSLYFKNTILKQDFFFKAKIIFLAKIN